MIEIIRVLTYKEIIPLSGRKLNKMVKLGLYNVQDTHHEFVMDMVASTCTCMKCMLPGVPYNARPKILSIWDFRAKSYLKSDGHAINHINGHHKNCSEDNNEALEWRNYLW